MKLLSLMACALAGTCLTLAAPVADAPTTPTSETIVEYRSLNPVYNARAELRWTCSQVINTLRVIGTSHVVVAFIAYGDDFAIAVCQIAGGDNCDAWGTAIKTGFAIIYVAAAGISSALPEQNPSKRDVDDGSLVEWWQAGLATSEVSADTVEILPFDGEDASLVRRNGDPQLLARVLLSGVQDPETGSKHDIIVNHFEGNNTVLHIPASGQSNIVSRATKLNKRVDGYGFKISYTTRLRSLLSASHQQEMAGFLAAGWLTYIDRITLDDYIGFAETDHSANFFYRIIPEIKGFGLNYETVDDTIAITPDHLHLYTIVVSATQFHRSNTESPTKARIRPSLGSVKQIMRDRSDSLTPPDRDGPETEDSGAHELTSSESEDHFSDAQSAPISSRASPIPKLRVEKVSDEPSYGEVPGTEAYKLREGDAEPDEIAIIPDEQSEDSEDKEGEEVKSPTPGGHPIPKTVVEESEDNSEAQSHPERKHRADPPPDLVLTADGKTEDGSSGAAVSDTPISPSLRSPRTPRARRKSSAATQKAATLSPSTAGFGAGDDEDFGDDFDDFEEGDDDADFGEFDDGFEEPEEPTPVPAAAQAPAVQPLSFPIPDFEGMDSDEIFAATEPYLNALFPTEESDTPSIPPLSKENPIFLTPRSASLWSQLVAPPPLQPPDWIRSRIRRLFLVSLGVPVDLDEILPASKQKKLILPSLHHVNSSGSLRTSTDSRGGGGGNNTTNNSIARLKQACDGNASSTSVDSQGKPSASSGKRRKGPPPVPDLDLVAAKQLCTTTDAALLGMTDAELRAHVARLESIEVTSKEVLEYWTKRTDEKIGDREAFEGVIENLVKHARKVRK